MNNLNNKQKLSLSIIVGIYHFIMPLIGLQFGHLINKIDVISIDIIASIILTYIGIDLIVSNYSKKEEKLTISMLGFLMFGLSVSIDSLSVGIGLKAITDSYYLSSVVFSLTSGLFTYLGLILGNIIGKKIGAIISGGEVDYTRVSEYILNDIKNEYVTKITFDRMD